MPGVLLSDRAGPGVVTLDSARAATQEWFKGTLRVVYDTDSQRDSLIADIAIKEAVADAAHSAIHPSQVHVIDGQVSCPALPLERISVEVEQSAPRTCRASCVVADRLATAAQLVHDQAGNAAGRIRRSFALGLAVALCQTRHRHGSRRDSGDSRAPRAAAGQPPSADRVDSGHDRSRRG